MKLLVIMLLLCNLAYSRWAVREDLSFSTLQSDTSILVSKDGTFKIHDRSTYEILKEDGKDKFSLYKIPYDAGVSSLKILSAKVINGNEIIVVDKSKIIETSVSKDKGLASSKEVQMALPKLRVGSKILIEYELNVSKIPVPGHFSLTTQMQGQGLLEKGYIEFISEVPLNIVTKDIYESFHLDETKPNGKFKYSFILKKPVLQELVEEAGALPPEKYSFIKVSTEKDWSKISTSLMKGFDDVIKEKLPDELEKVVAGLNKNTTTSEKVNSLVTYVVENLNYVGDWRSVKGSFAPKKIKELLEVKYGDCKDFASLLTVLLRKAGITADVALVHRSTPAYGRIQDITLPSLDTFNHAIVRVKDGEKSYWVDPTNAVSFGLDHREDIAGKNALVLDGLHSLNYIPVRTNKKDYFYIKKTVQFLGAENGNVSLSMNLEGSSALMFTGIGLKVPQDKLEKVLIGIGSQGEAAIIPEMEKVDLKSKMYRDLDFKIKYSASQLSIKSNESSLASLPPMDMYITPLNHEVSKWEGDLYIGQGMSMKKETFLKGIFAEKRSKGCRLSTPWVDISREFEYLPKGIKITDSISYKKSFIEKSSFKSTDFQMLQVKLSECASLRTVQFNYGAKKHNEAGLDIAEKLAKLPVKERVEKRFEFVRSVMNKETESALTEDDLNQLLKQNIHEDPKHAPSYQILASNIRQNGHMNGNNFAKANLTEAKKILAKGLQANPGHQGLYLSYLLYILDNEHGESVRKGIAKITSLGPIKEFWDMITLGTIYMQLGEKEKAIAALKSAEVVATLKWQKVRSWFQLAYSYSSFEMYGECVDAYDEVLKHDPKDAYTHINVIHCLSKLGRHDEAVERSRKGLTVTTAGMMTHVASTALSDRALYHYLKRNFDLAEKDYMESLQHRKNTGAYNGLAYIAAIHKKDFDKTVKLLDEGLQYHDEDPTYLMNTYLEVLEGSTPHYVQYLHKIIALTKNESQKLWGYYRIGMKLHKEKQRKELYSIMELAIQQGEAFIKSSPKDDSLAMSLGALYGLYGADADNSKLLSRGNELLLLARELNSKVEVGPYLEHVAKVQDAIKSGRTPASELNYNLKK